MRFLLVAVLCVAVTGCTFGAKTCTSAAECGGGECVSGFCVSEDAGAGGGGGGGSIGGGGGTTGGGGGVAECVSGCAAWQTCQPGNGGTCRTVAVAIVSPNAGAVFGGGTSARLVARVTDWDGGVFPGTSIPASATANVVAPSSLNRTDAGVFVGDFDLPMFGGTHTLTAGWTDAGASASVDVVTQVCSVSCADWQECLPNADGGTCGDLGLTLTWDLPTEDFKYAPSSAVGLSLSVTRADAGAFTKAVPYTLSGGASGMLMLDGGAWVAAVQSGVSDARRTLEAGWADGGPVHPVRHFLVDATPPVLGLVVIGDGGAFQRDAVIPAVLTSNEPLADAGVSLGGVTMARVPNVSCPNFGSVADASACFQLDFSQPVLNALEGGFAVTLSATDQYTNSGSGDGGVLPVTRVRWSIALPGTDVVRAAPALGTDGTLYIGTASGAGTTGSLFALTPEGATKPGWPGTGVSGVGVQGLAVGNPGTGDIVFFSANTTSGAVIGGVSAANGGTLNGGNQCNSTGLTYSGIGLVNTGGLRAVGALGVPGTLPDGGTNIARMCAFSASAGTPYINGADTANLNAPAVPGADSATNVAVDNTKAYFIGRGGRVFSSTLSSSWSSPLEARIGSNNSAIFSGGALFRNNAGTGWDLALSGGSNLGNLQYYTEGSGFSLVDLSGSLVGQPVLIPTSGPPTMYVYAGVDGAGLQRFDRNGVAGSPLATATLASSSPVLGAAGLGYVVDGIGELAVFPTVNPPVLAWRASLFPPASTVAASPTLDCVRDAGVGIAGARVGVLYVVSTGREVVAVLVDSPRLEAALSGSRAPWPKYQRTAGNAGNIDTSFPLNPGCP